MLLENPYLPWLEVLASRPPPIEISSGDKVFRPTDEALKSWDDLGGSLIMKKLVAEELIRLTPS